MKQYTTTELAELTKEAFNKAREAKNAYDALYYVYKDLKAQLKEAHINADKERLGLVGIDLGLAAHKASCYFSRIIELEGKTYTFQQCYIELIEALNKEYRRTHDGVADSYITSLLLLYEYEDCTAFGIKLSKREQLFYKLFREQFIGAVTESL